jgi:large subunit ribosomal protein L9
MKVVLLQDVKGQGKKGDVIEVSEGYGRNFLINKKLAKIATTDVLNVISLQKQAEERRLQEAAKKALEDQKKLKDKVVTISVKTGQSGKLFGAVTGSDIAEALSKECFSVDKKSVVLKDPIKNEGTYDVEIKLHQDIKAKIKVVIIKDE